MTKDELFALSGMPGVIDTALPQPWYDAVSKATGRNPVQDFVWYYPPGSMCGMPLCVGEMYAAAMENGALLTFEQAKFIAAHEKAHRMLEATRNPKPFYIKGEL